jgi:hypothetical protein
MYWVQREMEHCEWFTANYELPLLLICLNFPGRNFRDSATFHPLHILMSNMKICQARMILKTANSADITLKFGSTWIQTPDTLRKFNMSHKFYNPKQTQSHSITADRICTVLLQKYNVQNEVVLNLPWSQLGAFHTEPCYAWDVLILS